MQQIFHVNVIKTLWHVQRVGGGDADLLATRGERRGHAHPLDIRARLFVYWWVTACGWKNVHTHSCSQGSTQSAKGKLVGLGPSWSEF